MKSKLISLLLVISLLLNGALIAYADGGIESDPYFEGSGTEADPYLIGTAEDLMQLSSLSNAAETGITYADKYYRLTADIDMDGIDYKPICYGTNMSTPANGGGADGRFSGTLDGGGHVIQNVSIPASYLSGYGATAGVIGLLGANGTVKKLGVENMTVTTGNANRLCIGGLAGSLLVGISIRECYVRGMTVNGAAIANSSSFAYVGGLAGRTIGNSGTITNCYSTGLSYTLSNANYSAGLLGSCGNVAYSAANCYTTHEKTDGYTSATNSYLSKSNCYVSADLADIQAEDLGKAFVENQTEENDGYPLLAWEVGEEYDPDPTDEATEEPTSSPEPTTDPEQTDPNFKGSGTEADPFLIRSANDLTTLASLTNSPDTAGNYANKYYRLTADIDMTGVSYKPISYGTSMYTAQAARFTGTLDGDGHIIKNITINSNLATYGATAGIIGILGADGVVKNLGVENMSITTTANSTYMCIGGIAGSLMANMSIDRCYVRGMTVSATNAGSPCFVGGLVGRTIGNAGTITNSYTSGLSFTVPHDTTHSAGIMGACGNTGYSATNSYTTHAKIQGNVAATNSYLGMTNCYASANLSDISAAVLGDAFFDHQTVKNDGYPLLAWESTEGYDPQPAGEPTEEPEQTDPNFTGNGTKTKPFLIGSASDLTTLASLTNSPETAGNYANKYYRLTADIDMTGVSYKPISYGTSMYTAQAARFTGTLDGDGHVIKNISIPASYLSTYGATAGIIGVLGTNGVVKNLGVENMTVTTGSSIYLCIGGIAGCLAANDMVFDKCYVRGMTVNAESAGSPCFVGGLAGRTAGQTGAITNSYSTNLAFTVTNDTTHSAGIMGACGNTGYSATNCYTTHAKIEGNVAATNSYLTKSNCYKADTITNITPANLGEAFDADEAHFNDGLPILVWEYDVQHPETVTYDITVNGEEISDAQANVPASHEIVVTFDRAMNSDTLGNISLLKNGQKIENLEFRLSGNVLTIIPPLEFGTRYTLFIPKTVQSVKNGEGMSAKAEEKNITFMTENTLAVKEIKLNGKAVSEAEIRAGDEVAAEVKVKNANAFSSQDAAVIVALYDKSGVMKYAAFNTVKIPKSGEADLSATLHIPDSMEEGFEISVMVWDSATEMNAVCRAYSHE